MARKPRIIGAFEPPPYDESVVYSMQALAAGKASEGQQKLAITWIVNHAAATYDLPYRPGVDGQRDTDFACGRMFVGLQIVKMLNIVPLAKEKAT